MRTIKKGATSQSIYVDVLDSTSTTGGRKTGLAYNTSSLTAYYVRNQSTATAITLATLAAANTAWSSGGFKEVDATNMPGVYRLDVPDAAFATGAGDDVVIVIKGATGMVQASCDVQLVAIDPQDAVRSGLTALPNAAAEAAGGLYTRGTGAGQINQDANGRVDVNGKAWAGGAVPAPNVTGVPIVDDKYLLGTIYSTPATAGIQDINVINWKGSAAAAMTGDAYARLGAPAGASVSADVAAVKVDTSAIKVQTDKVTFTVANQVDVNVLDWKSATAPAMTGDAFARLGAPAGASVSADVAAVKGVLPAALVSGRIDASVGAMAAAVLTATAIAADAITDAKVASDVTIASVTGAVGSVTGAVGSVTGNVGGNVTGSVGSVTGLTASNLDATISSRLAGASYTAPLDAAGTRTAVGLASANLDTQLDALPTNAELATAFAAADDATLAAIAGLNNLSAAQVNAEVDTALADVGVTATVTGRIDAAISTRLAAGSYTAPDNATIASIDGKATTILAGVVAIDAKTTNLPSDPADQSLVIAATNAIMTRLGTPADTDIATDIANIPVGTAPTADEIADEVQTRTIAAVTLVNSLAAGSLDAAALAGDAVTEIQAGLASQSSIDALPAATDVAAAVLAATYEGGETVQDHYRLARAALYGVADGLDGSTVHYRDAADSKNRLTATVDADGNRLAVTTDAT
ncbi:hypothetical protein NKG99_03835 [Mesorhizobium sp. M1409]|uniref:hypothetical protein n=1 Tax=Mesorhizobium sp. M1409 TaxID=2957100 RepID=UPI00333A0D29